MSHDGKSFKKQYVMEHHSALTAGTKKNRAGSSGAVNATHKEEEWGTVAQLKFPTCAFFVL